jgi:hypothetical protein
MLFVVKSPKIYQSNTSVHGRNTRQHDKLHVPSVRSSTIQIGVYYLSVKIFNHHPQNISKLHNNIHIFKTVLSSCLVQNAFILLMNFFVKIVIVNQQQIVQLLLHSFCSSLFLATYMCIL